jgi:para-nitrobenzyl esterase
VSPEDLVRVPSAIGPLESGMRYGPVIDGVVVPGYGPDIIAAGQHNAVPMILGTNADETSKMVPHVTTEPEYEAAVRAQYGTSLGNQILAQYPASRFATPQKALIAVTTDSIWTCNARRDVRALAAHQSQPVFRYFFSWHSSGAQGAVVGSTHGLEIPFVFSTLSTFNGFMPDPATSALSVAMGNYWTQLAKTGDVNGAGAPAWTPFPASGVETALQLDNTIAPTSDVRESDCDFWDALSP